MFKVSDPPSPTVFMYVFNLLTTGQQLLPSSIMTNQDPLIWALHVGAQWLSAHSCPVYKNLNVKQSSKCCCKYINSKKSWRKQRRTHVSRWRCRWWEAAGRWRSRTNENVIMQLSWGQLHPPPHTFFFGFHSNYTVSFTTSRSKNISLTVKKLYITAIHLFSHCLGLMQTDEWRNYIMSRKHLPPQTQVRNVSEMLKLSNSPRIFKSFTKLVCRLKWHHLFWAPCLLFCSKFTSHCQKQLKISKVLIVWMTWQHSDKINQTENIISPSVADIII